MNPRRAAVAVVTRDPQSAEFPVVGDHQGWYHTREKRHSDLTLPQLRPTNEDHFTGFAVANCHTSHVRQHWPQTL